jgi:hypothetical protein
MYDDYQPSNEAVELIDQLWFEHDDLETVKAILRDALIRRAQIEQDLICAK